MAKMFFFSFFFLTVIFSFAAQVRLGKYLYEKLSSVPGVRIYGPRPSESVQRAALCSFNVEGLHPTDLATFLDQQVCYNCELICPITCWFFLFFSECYSLGRGGMTYYATLQ